jgi:hypothetical protein
MSVPKSRRGESPAEYINLAREIYVFTYNRVRILPKSYTFYFSLPLYNAAREAYRMIKTANLIYVDEKSPEEIRRRNIQRRKEYYETAQHEPVFREFERSGIDDRLVALSKYFIQNFGDVGLGLGSQVSQIAALALPNRIDHYIKDVLGMKYYARYMDDGCIISESKEKLEICLRELRRLCAEHGIRLNPKKTQIIKLTRGFTFVKVRFRYGANGKVVRRATYKGIRHMRAKLRIFRRWVDSGRMTAADVETSLVSWRGHMKRFHSYHMEQSVERLYCELFKGG